MRNLKAFGCATELQNSKRSSKSKADGHRLNELHAAIHRPAGSSLKMTACHLTGNEQRQRYDDVRATVLAERGMTLVVIDCSRAS
jgi:hypothetical protein